MGTGVLSFIRIKAVLWLGVRIYGVISIGNMHVLYTHFSLKIDIDNIVLCYKGPLRMVGVVHGSTV